MAGKRKVEDYGLQISMSLKKKPLDDSFEYRDFSSLALKKDHETRPIWITPDHRIFLETFSSKYRAAYEFLIAIAEPISRPAFIHEYELTQYSLYAAMVVQLTPDKIKELLNKLCKNATIPYEVIEFIDKNTKKYGSAKLFLNGNRYFLQIFDPTIFNELLPNIKEKLILRQNSDMMIENVDFQGKTVVHHDIDKILKECSEEKLIEELEKLGNNENFTGSNAVSDPALHDEKKRSYQIYEIKGEHTEVTKCFIEKNIPVIEEYDFQMNEENPKLDIELSPATKIRYYQEKALSKVFISGKARSGVIVLPCGAGKTLVGITATTRVKKRTVIFCNTALAIQQWKYQFRKFTDIPDDKIICLTAKHVNEASYRKVAETGFILITTYSMITKGKRISKNEKTIKKQEILDDLKSKEWGLCILDEVQVVPANEFQQVLLKIKSHFKLGLTATLIREDDKIENLNYMIGPKLYEENWLDLVNQGYLARPYCVEIRCPMTPEFGQEYRRRQAQDKILLHAGNPNKFLVLQYLIKKHEDRGDKIIVFSDKPDILQIYGEKLKIPVAHGRVTHEERVFILEKFKGTRKINTIMISSIGDTAIDLPTANVVIQISSHFGSRRQEAQRLGRIMRPKENELSEYNAFFYTLVSLETDETLYATKRQKFLIDQGFSFEIVSDIVLPTNLMMSSVEEQRLYLAKLMEKMGGNEMKMPDPMRDDESESEPNGDIEGNSSDYTDDDYEEVEDTNPLKTETIMIARK